MIKINVITNNISWFRFIKNPNNYIDRKVKKLNLKNKKLKKKTIYCTLLLSGSHEIKNLNKKFRKKNKSTDVLSFPLNKKISKNNLYLGDVIISYQYMNNPRSINNLNFKKKVIKIFIHGFLHLLGYDHIKEKDFINMFKEEERIFNFVERKIDKIIKI